MQSSNKRAKGICHVHFLVYGDKEDRNIAYCGMCDAWICDECSPKTILRAEAMAIGVVKRLAGEIEKDGYSMFPVYLDGKLINNKKPQ